MVDEEKTQKRFDRIEVVPKAYEIFNDIPEIDIETLYDIYEYLGSEIMEGQSCTEYGKAVFAQ